MFKIFVSSFSGLASYHGPFVPDFHSADYLFTARTNVAGQIVSDSFKQSKGTAGLICVDYR